MGQTVLRGWIRSGIATGLVFGLGVACSPDEAPSPAGRTNIVLITLDTLRGDHLGLYGYDDDTSPHLDALGARSTVYLTARSTSPWTLPSHASMFTGLYPFEHGAHSNERRIAPDDRLLEFKQGEREKGRWALRVGNAYPLADDAVTLAEYLKERGYNTAAFFSNIGYLVRRFQLNQGFDHYVKCPTPGSVLNDKVTDWLEGAPDQPFFLFLNYMDTHRIYNCTPRDGREDLGTPKESVELMEELLQDMYEGKELDPAKTERLIGMYDNAIYNLDAYLGELFAELQRRGLWDDTLILVTSDHGEYFGEHGLVEHSKDVYEAALNIPFIVKAPGQTEGKVVEEPISLVHVPGLILTTLGLDAQAPPELLSHWPPRALLAENYYSRLHDLDRESRFDRVRRALFLDGFKYIDSTDGQNELYDLAKDPDETTNLVDELPSRSESFRAMVQQWISTRAEKPRAELPELTEEEWENLKALGYGGED